MPAAPAAFKPDERAKIAALLGLAGDRVRAAKWVDWLDTEVLYQRQFDRRVDGIIRQEVERSGAARGRRGRPASMLASRGYELIHAAAVAYFRCTGKQPTNSRGGAFYQLAQLCTLLGDPAPLIARLPRPFSGQPLPDSDPIP